MIKTSMISFFRLCSSLALVAALASCSDEGGKTMVDAPAGPAGCSASDATVTIATNHPHGKHALVVSSADVQAGLDKTYDIMGVAVHTHMVTITAADFTMLKAGGTIMVTSTAFEGNMHVITVSCA
ncbi:MAG: hypothetical protein H0T42_21085 [Deltaproteobacteria bacterium]|nr:hypothetical protein [Deltaproteobacteria bacterium]